MHQRDLPCEKEFNPKYATHEKHVPVYYIALGLHNTADDCDIYIRNEVVTIIDDLQQLAGSEIRIYNDMSLLMLGFNIYNNKANQATQTRSI